MAKGKQEIGLSRSVWAQAAASCPTTRGAWRLRVRDGKAALACISQEAESEVVLPCVVEDGVRVEGRVAKLDRFLEILRLQGEDFVTVGYNPPREDDAASTLSFRVGGSSLSFKLQPWLEGMFPDMDTEAPFEEIELEREELANALVCVIPAMAARNSYRYAYQAVHVFSEGGKLCFEATDGVWLARYEMPSAGIPEIDMVVPADLAKTLLVLLRKCGGEAVTLRWNEDMVELRTNTHRARGLLYAEKFPSTSHIWAKRPDAGYRVDYADFARAVRFMRGLIRHDRYLGTPAYGFWFANDGDVHCHTEDSSGGDALVQVPFKAEGEMDPARAAGPCFVTLQSHIVTAILGHKADTIWLGYTGRENPVFVEFGEGGQAPLYVVSPLKLERIPEWITSEEGVICMEVGAERAA